MKFTDYLLSWLDGMCYRLEKSTYEAYQIYIKRHAIPYFDKLNLNLQDISPIYINDYMRFLATSGRLDKPGGLSRVSVRKNISVLKQALNDSVALGLLNNNPGIFIKTKKVENISSKSMFLTYDDTNYMLSLLKDNYLYPIIFTTIVYGLRRSEALGLKWSAINFDNNTININFTVVKNLTIVEKPRTKTYLSNSTYELLPEVKSVLIELKNKEIADGTYKYDGFCFLRGSDPFRPDTLTRSFQRFLKSHQLPIMRFHDLRHTTASVLFEKGWSERDVREWLRHSNIQTTMNIYVHYQHSRKIIKGRELNELFRQKRLSENNL